MFCRSCGKELSDNAVMCPQCGEPMRTTASIPGDASEKEWMPTLLLCFFLGGLGAHSFYVGKTTAGIIQLLTLGVCGIWTLIDFIMLLTKSYTDGNGRVVVK